MLYTTDHQKIKTNLKRYVLNWKIFPALYNHLYNASNDSTKDKKTQSKYTGLYKKLRSPQFVLDLALMCDILKELSYLSNQLQSHTVTLLQADQLIKRTIRVY